MLFHRVSVIVLALFLMSGVLDPGLASERPNVLMIAIDDLSDYVSILQDHPGIKTPHFDRLAKRSLNFTRAYCAAPLCQPSRAAVITGMAPHQTGIYDLGHSMTNSPPAMAAIGLEEQFKRHGYDTYQTGKLYHAEPTKRAWPAERMKSAWTEMKEPFSDHGPMLANGNTIMGRGISAIGPAPGGLATMPDVACLKNTQGWLAQQHDKPFLIVHGINMPHVAFVVPQEFFDLYPLDEIVVPEVPLDDIEDLPNKMWVESRQFRKVRDSKNGWNQIMQAYMASISFCDWVLGELLDSLDSSPYADNTIVVLWSDHGYHIGEKERFAKRALWTQTSRVPFLISVPGMTTASRNCDASVSLLDIYPTLYEFCHFDQNVPQTLAGHSLRSLLQNPNHGWPHVAVTSHGEGNAAVTDARYHYIQYADGSKEVYDHQTDPREYNNLAQQPNLKPVMERLAESIPKSWIRADSKRRDLTAETPGTKEE